MRLDWKDGRERREQLGGSRESRGGENLRSLAQTGFLGEKRRKGDRQRPGGQRPPAAGGVREACDRLPHAWPPAGREKTIRQAIATSDASKRRKRLARDRKQASQEEAIARSKKRPKRMPWHAYRLACDRLRSLATRGLSASKMKENKVIALNETSQGFTKASTEAEPNEEGAVWGQ